MRGNDVNLNFHVASKAIFNLKVTQDKFDRERVVTQTAITFGHLNLAPLMAYTFFFLLGIPLWLIASTRILRSNAHALGLKAAWAAVAFFAPLVIFGLASIAHTMIAQRLGETAALTRGFGYIFIAVSFLAFFSPFAVSSAFKSRYGAAWRLPRR
jgi:hypothetical protein